MEDGSINTAIIMIKMDSLAMNPKMIIILMTNIPVQIILTNKINIKKSSVAQIDITKTKKNKIIQIIKPYKESHQIYKT